MLQSSPIKRSPLEKEGEKIEPQAHVRGRSPFARFPWFFLFLAIFMGLSWMGLRYLHQLGVAEMGKPRKFGDLTYTPEGFWSEGWLRYGWKKVTLEWPGGKSVLHGPSITLRILSQAPYYENAKIQFDSIYTFSDPDSTSKDTLHHKTVPSYVFPELNIPARALIVTGPIHAQLAHQGDWNLDSLRIFNSSSKSIELHTQNLQGKYIHTPIQMLSKIDWQGGFLNLESGILTHCDTITLQAEAPLDHLDDIGLHARIYLAEVKDWMPPQNQIPRAQNLRLQIQGVAQLRKKQYQGNVTLDADLAPVQMLPQGHLHIDAQGDESLKSAASLHWQGKNPQQFAKISGKYRKGVLEASGKLHGLDMNVGSQRMPLDGEIHRLRWKGDSLYADITTLNQSDLRIWASNLKDPFAHLELSVSPTEPWALSWTAPNLQIAPPSTITGDYHRGVLTANLKTALPLAFQTTAEVFESDLTVTSKGVYFDNGSFRSHGVDHYFTGEVVWDPEQSYYQFELEQIPKGNIQAYGDFDGNIRIHVTDLSTKHLPLADTTLLQGIDAKFTGTWDHHFAEKRGTLDANLSTAYHGIALDLSVKAHQAGDTLELERGIVYTQGSALLLKAIAIVDSASGKPLPMWAQVSTQRFDLPAFLLAIGDSTLSQAEVHGNMQWTPQSGLKGELNIPLLTLKNKTPEQLTIHRISIQGNGAQAIVSARAHLDTDGLFDSEVEMQVDSLFSWRKKLGIAMVTDHGGIFWAEGFYDSTGIFKGTSSLMGNWLLSANGLELQNSHFQANISVDSHKGLAGVMVGFQLDSAILATTGISFPFSFTGALENSVVRLDRLHIEGHDKTELNGHVAFDLEQKQLQGLDLIADKFNLHYLGIHHLEVEHFRTLARADEQGLLVQAISPHIEYRLKDTTLGNALVRAKTEIALRMPQQKQGLANLPMRIEGRTEIGRLLYEKNFPVELDSRLFSLIFEKVANFFGKKETPSKAEVANTKVASSTGAKSNPIELDLRILDPGGDSLLIKTNVATIPLTLDLQVRGTTENPLLTGDINSAGKGFVGIDNIAKLELEQLRLNWLDAPPKQGQVEVKTVKDVPYCQQTQENRIEVCKVNLNVNGSITKPIPVPQADCGTELTPAQIYYDVFLLGCIPEQGAVGTDPNGIANRILGVAASKVLNSSLGGDYFGDIDLHLKLLGQDAGAADSSSVRIPLKLDRWVKNLRLEMAYTQNSSTGAAQSGAQSYELGLRYSMPVLDSGEVVENHIDPMLNFSGNLIARRNQTTTSAAQENLVERKATVDYRWQFWDMCLFGIGFCTQEQKP